MKRSELEQIIVEELTSILTQLSEIAVTKNRKASFGKKLKKKQNPAGPNKQSYDSAGTVPTIRNRKMTKSQISKREQIGKKIVNAMRRGKKDSNKVYQSLLRHAEKHGYENPSQKQLLSFAWAMASDYAIKGRDFSTGKGKTAKKKSKKSGETK